MAGRRDAILAHRHATGGGDLGADLGRRQHPTVAGLGALGQLDLDHLHLRARGLFGKALRVEAPIGVATTEIARTQLPDQVAAVFEVVGRDRAFAGVVIETASACALVERAHRIGRQRAETHGRDVEHAGRVRLRAVRPDLHPEIVPLDLGRRQRVVDPLVVHRVGVLQAAEGHHVHLALGAAVHQGALLARERRLGGIGLDEVLAHLWPHRLQPIAEVGQDRVVAAQGAALLQQVGAAQQHQRRGDAHAPPPARPAQRQRQAGQQHDPGADIGGIAAHPGSRGDRGHQSSRCPRRVAGPAPGRSAMAQCPAPRPGGETGRHRRLKIFQPQGYAGSTPAPGIPGFPPRKNPRREPGVLVWRPGSELNRRTRICSPLHDHSATRPEACAVAAV